MNSCRKQLMKDWWNEKNEVRKFPFLDFERLCHRRLTRLEKYLVVSLSFSHLEFYHTIMLPQKYLKIKYLF